MNRSTIPYLSHTWNPMTGCSPVSAGCANCWARAYHARYRKGDFSVKLHPEKLDAPLRLRKPSVIGVCLMGDLMHDDVPDDFIVAVFVAMARAPRHLYLLLTKRPLRARKQLRPFGGEAPANVWLGVSCEDRASLARVDVLRDTPAAHRWISLEPQVEDVGELDLRGISLVVQGAESGPKRRPFDLQWARDVRDVCLSSGVCYYLKQVPAEVHTTGDIWSKNGRRKKGQIVETPMLDGHRCTSACLPWSHRSSGAEPKGKEGA